MTPGVYVEEVSTGTKPIGMAGTSTAAFLGVAPATDARLNEAVACNNWSQFVREFVRKDSPSTDLALAVFGFFLNGGGRCYVVNLGEGKPVAGDAHQRTGLYCLEAAAELLIAQPWLHRTGFTGKFVSVNRRLVDERATAAVDWAAAISALDTGDLPCSGGEQRMLRVTASLADGLPVDLRDALTGIDDHNVQLLLKAVLHASGQRPSPQTP
jgi:hypothetical protein